MQQEILIKLEHILQERKNAAPETSYVSSLYAAGNEKILKKLGEEAVECLLAASSGRREAIVHETADLWFHIMVMLVHHGVGVQEIMAELERRFGVSGLEEKAARKG